MSLPSIGEHHCEQCGKHTPHSATGDMHLIGDEFAEVHCECDVCGWELVIDVPAEDQEKYNPNCTYCAGTGGSWHCCEYHAHSRERCTVHTCKRCTGRDEYIAPGSPEERYP